MNEKIKEVHDEVEKMPFSLSLFKGDLTDTQSIAYMVNQWFIFQAMEHNIFRKLPHPSLPRCDKISDCVIALGGKIDGDLMCRATARYINYIVGVEDDKDKWYSHVYLNYMAMLMGGQIISERNPDMELMWNFSDTTNAIKSIRKLKIDWDQVYNGFLYHRDMLKELEEVE